MARPATVRAAAATAVPREVVAAPGATAAGLAGLVAVVMALTVLA